MKASSNYWSGLYECIDKSCPVVFNCSLKSPPSESSGAILHIKIDGIATHEKLSNNRITGLKRTLMAHELVSRHTLNVETDNSLFNISNSANTSIHFYDSFFIDIKYVLNCF